ncbi:MAG: cytochrome P450 [Actinobacteria bacterium]|nr:cytochrome P450 [Actinomycetota bacterium]
MWSDGSVHDVDWDRIHAEERAARPDAAWLDDDLLDFAAYRDGIPYARYAALRDTRPVWRHPTAPTPRSPGGVGFWAVLGHPEVQTVSRDWRTYSALQGFALTTARPDMQDRTILTTDPPRHTRIRKLISAGFTPRMIARLDELVVERTTQVLDAAAARPTFNFVQEVAYRLPMHMIADILGIPESDRDDVFRWTDVIMRHTDPALGMSMDEVRAAEGALFAYGAQLGAQKRRHPDDDVWSILANATIDDDGEAFTLDAGELDLFFLILTIAGSETTRNAISTGLCALHADAAARERLRDDPTVAATATEEILRWSSPVTCHLRTATLTHELGGQTIEAGDRVAMFFPAANRDPRAFADPDVFDITRDPNPHVAFGGGGVHYCLGAHLARREITLVFRELLTRFPDWEVTGPVSQIVTGVEQTVAVSHDDIPVRLVP